MKTSSANLQVSIFPGYRSNFPGLESILKVQFQVGPQLRVFYKEDHRFLARNK